jgi:twitching motility protein PilT
MRDLETIEAALVLSETGHLTFGTLHTSDAVQTINRIIDVFPEGQQGQIRTQLSFVLEAAVAQTLLPHASGKGRVLVQEILVPNAAIRNLIREDKIHQIYSSMQSGQSQHGMKTFNQDLARLVMEKQVTVDTAMDTSPDKNELAATLERAQAAALSGQRIPGGRSEPDDRVRRMRGRR